MDISKFSHFSKVKTRDKSGIYIIYNINSEKYYIGSAKNLANRKATHLRDLRRNKHKNHYLQNSYNKNGESAFRFYLAEYVNPTYLVKAEQKYLDKFTPYNKKIGYNIAKIAGSTLGVKPSAETRKKQSVAAKNRKNKVPRGEENPKSKLTWNIIHEMKEKYSTGKFSQTDLSKEYNICRRHIGNILNGLAWDNGSGKVEKPIKMNKLIADKIRKDFKNKKLSRKELAKKYNIGYQAVRFILNNKTWK